MTLFDSFFDSMVQLDADTLVMQVGHRPYIFRAEPPYRGSLEWGQLELSTTPMSLGTALSMLEQILPTEQFQMLSDFGAIEHELTPPGHSDERITVVAARGGDDVWVEVRRRARKPAIAEPPIEETPTAPIAPIEPHVEPTVEQPVEYAIDLTPQGAIERPIDAPAEPASEPAIELPMESLIGDPGSMFEIVMERGREALREPLDDVEAPPEREPVPEPLDDVVAQPEYEPVPEPLADVGVHREREPVPEPAEQIAAEPAIDEIEHEEVHEPPVPERPLVLVPIARPAPKPAVPPPPRPPQPHLMEDALRAAMDAGAATAHIVAGTKPMARVNGRMRPLNADPVPADAIARFLKERGITRGDAWEGEVPEVGRVRCAAFDDCRGVAVTIEFAPAALPNADHLGLPDAAQALSEEADGLVLIAGPRASGKSTIAHAFVDVINRTRCDYVIALESRVTFVHEPQHSFISQREMIGDDEDVAVALRSALREGPDVLVVDDVRARDAAAIALDAARAGRLVIATVAAPTADAAIDRMLDGFLPARRAQVRALLSAVLRGVIVQTLVKSVAGPLVPAREVRLMKTGIVYSLQDSLVQLVRDDRVSMAEALAAAPDREAFSAAIEHGRFEGERFA